MCCAHDACTSQTQSIYLNLRYMHACLHVALQANNDMSKKAWNKISTRGLILSSKTYQMQNGMFRTWKLDNGSEVSAEELKIRVPPPPSTDSDRHHNPPKPESRALIANEQPAVPNSHPRRQLRRSAQRHILIRLISHAHTSTALQATLHASPGN